MLFDSIQVANGGISNLVIASGGTFPSQADVGELFYRVDLEKLYLYTGIVRGWAAIPLEFQV